MIPLFEDLDLSSPHTVEAIFRRGAEACRCAACRMGAVEVIRPPGRLLATGDLHDNPVALARLAERAGLASAGAIPAAHLTLHEIIHSDRLSQGMDFSYRALARVALLKATFPEHVHPLLANHELAQVVGAGITKDGLNVVRAFNEGLEYVFGDDAPAVNDALVDFVRAMPLALRVTGVAGAPDLLCAHSLPGPLAMDRFDPGVLERSLTEGDLEPRTGSAYLMTWGRGQTPRDLSTLAARWGVALFILGHEKAETGAMAIEPNVLILNTDHERASVLELDLAARPTLSEALAQVSLL
ncbi:MAG: hypothetical protein ACT4PL_10470 [Phycisphaerales bacterium]